MVKWMIINGRKGNLNERFTDKIFKTIWKTNYPGYSIPITAGYV